MAANPRDPSSIHATARPGRVVAAATSGPLCSGGMTNDSAHQAEGGHMAGTYKLIEIVGTSTEGLSQAIDSAIEHAAKTIRNLHWFEVVEQRGTIRNGHVLEYQVKIRVGFKLEPGDSAH
jgi:flavin-binding protein dodecin